MKEDNLAQFTQYKIGDFSNIIQDKPIVFDGKKID